MLGVEENKPSLFIASLTDGEVSRRITPAGKTLSGAEYEVDDVLPPVLRQRRVNRGFEGVALSADGKTAYTATQSPLRSTNATRLIRILRLDVSDPDDVTVTGEFVWLMSPASVYPQGVSSGTSTRQQDLKLSAISWVATNKLLLLEQSDRIGNDGVGKGGVRLILADLTNATNVLGQSAYDGTEADPASGLSLEALNTSVAANGITPAELTVMFEEFETASDRFFNTYKLEGLAILNASQLAIINDNDFGIDPAVQPGLPTRLWKLRLADPLPLGK